MVVEPLIVGLLLMAALMHASWNAILKSDQSDRLATFGVIMTTGTGMGLCAPCRSCPGSSRRHGNTSRARC
jgi:hypothetical protein